MTHQKGICNTPNGPNCEKVAHVRYNDPFPMDQWGLLIDYDRPCDDDGDIERGVVLFDLWADLFASVYIPGSGWVRMPIGLYKKYCCCVQYIKVFSCTPGPPGCIPLYQQCGLPDFDPFTDIMTFRSKPGYDHDICAYSVPPDKVDSCGLTAPYWVVSGDCSFGCDGFADLWNINLEEVEVRVKKYTGPEMIYDPEGIFAERLCLELCGPCYSLFEDCGSCNSGLAPEGGGRCLSQGCPGMNSQNTMRMYSNDCYPGCDPSEWEQGPPSWWGPLCQGCLEKTNEYTGEQIANNPDLYYLPACGEVGGDSPFTTEEGSPCYNCNHTLWDRCSDCVGLEFEDPPFYCPDKTFGGTWEGEFPFARMEGITDPPDTTNHGYACYSLAQETSGISPIPNDYLTHAVFDFFANCCGNVAPDWTPNMCICGVPAPPPAGGEPEGSGFPIPLPPADFDAGHLRFFPETIEATIEINNEHINKSVDIRFSSSKRIPTPNSLARSIGTQSRIPIVYFLEDHGDLENIPKHSIGGAFAQGIVPHVNSAIYLGDYLDGEKKRSAWLHVGYCTAQTLVHSKSRVFTFDYSVFSYCKEEPCKELSGLLEPKKTVTFSLK